MTYQDIIAFWFEEIESQKRWVKDPEFDLHIKQRFGEIHSQAKNNQLEAWRKKPLGRLAEIIVLDQFSRNMFRDLPEAFAQDALALELAREAVRTGDDQKIDLSKRSFLYMPYMHSESLSVHEEALKLFAQPGMEGNLDFEVKHKIIIERFGRYPHRNKILGRESSPEELEFLKGPASFF